MGPHIGRVPFIGHRGIRVEHMTGGTSRLTMPLVDDNCDQSGGVHEGAVLALLDTTGAMASWAQSGPGPYKASTASMQLQILGPVPAGDLGRLRALRTKRPGDLLVRRRGRECERRPWLRPRQCALPHRHLIPCCAPCDLSHSMSQGGVPAADDGPQCVCEIREVAAVRSLDEDLWVIDHPFRMPGGIELGTRTTLVRLANGGLWLHSPGPLTPAIQAWLEENGPVRAIVAPNLLHHLFLADTVAAFPEASIHGPEGLSEKIGTKLGPGVRIQALDPQRLPWAGDLECLLVPGCPAMNELAFLHAKTRTLILTDLAFNIRQASSLLTRIFLRINGALGSFGPSRLARVFFLKDRSQVRTGIEQILAWDFDRVVVAHGEVLERDGNRALRDSYGWLLNA